MEGNVKGERLIITKSGWNWRVKVGASFQKKD